MNFKEAVKRELKEWADAVVTALVLGMFITTFFIQQFKIPSGSMIPTFNVGDRIFVDKFLYSARIPFINFKFPIPSLRQVKRGDIIVFISPEEPRKDFVKRLIALGGEKVEISDGKVIVNAQALDIPAVRSVYYYNAGDYGTEGRIVEVPKDSYFVLGDNSASSRDSRYWGFVPKKNLIGKAVVICWPLHRIKLLNRAQ